MFWIFLVAAVAVLVWALQKQSASARAGQSPTYRMANSGQTAPPPAQWLPPGAAPPKAFEAPKRLAQVQPPPTLMSGKRSVAARWVPAGETVETAGFSLPGGMLYVGSSLPAVKQWAVGVEPALLDPTLPVDKRSADIEGRQMPYWPSYSQIHPSCRSAYLQWLAGGRRDPKAYIGYVFLFFYGLERRLLFDNGRSQLSTDEIDGLRAEVDRLLGLYGANNSFHRYASSLLGLGLLLRRSIDILELRPPMHRDGWELPLVVQVALGVLASEEKPLPPGWALSWVLTSPEVPLRTPAQRCPEEFRELFLLRYQESFGEGLRLRPNQTRLRIDYRPASASFGGPVALTVDLPDIARTAATLDRLRKLAEQCSQELDPFSRWVGRTGETASPPAIALLPPPLTRGRGDEATRALGDWLAAQLVGQNLALIESSELLRRWPSKEPGRPSRRELETLSDFLASRGYGIEPDVALGGAALTRCRRATLFRLPEGARSEPSPAYHGAAVLLQLAATVAAADGEVTVAEERHLMEHLDTALELPAADRARLEARFRWLAADPPTFTRSKKNLEEIPQEERKSLGAFLISLAAADGHLAPGEMKVLSKVYPLLGLDPQSLYADVHQLMSTQTAPAEEPVPVRPAEPPKGFAVPRPPQAATPQTLELDLAKVRAKLAETERVSRLLGEIFVDEEEALPAAAPPPVAATDDFAVAGLDGAHSALLLRLGGARSWDRAQVERWADSLGLLPDGALEVINEAAIAACGAPLLEGDERIEIDQEVLQEMLS